MKTALTFTLAFLLSSIVIGCIYGMIIVNYVTKIKEAVINEIQGLNNYFMNIDRFSCTNPTCKRRTTASTFIDTQLFKIGKNVYDRELERQEKEKAVVCNDCDIYHICADKEPDKISCVLKEVVGCVKDEGDVDGRTSQSLGLCSLCEDKEECCEATPDKCSCGGFKYGEQ